MLSCLLLAFALCSCGASEKNAAYEPDVRGDYGYYSDEAFNEEVKSEAVSADSNSAQGSDYQAIADASSRKLIKDASLEIQTEAYDEFNKQLRSEIKECGGYIESSSEYGSGYEYSSYRSERITVRIPADKLDGFISEISDIASVTYQSVSVRDVTGDYIDTESRITALKTERDALLKILEKADNVNDLITVQERLSKVNTEIQSNESKLKTYDELISYSKVEMDISEVNRAVSSEKLSFFGEIGRRLSDNLYNIGRGLRSFAIWFISSLPYIAVFAVLIIAAVLIIKRIVRKRKQRKESKTENQ